MSVKKLSFYLDSANITLRSDHKPLQKFLDKNTMNAKVNNWAVELESYNIKFCFIEGQKNVLADTLSRLIEINNDVKTARRGARLWVWLHAIRGASSSPGWSSRGSHHSWRLWKRRGTAPSWETGESGAPSPKYQFQTTRWWNSKNRTSTSAAWEQSGDSGD